MSIRKQYYKGRFIFVLLLLLTACYSYAQQSTTAKDTTVKARLSPAVAYVEDSGRAIIERMRLRTLRFVPNISIQQMLKGNGVGVYVQESSGEPGTDLNMFLHGMSSPLLSKKVLCNQQPLVYLDGIPLIRDHPFAYAIQKYDVNRIGTTTNNLAIFNIDNIESVEVVTDPVKLSALGPLASNGAILVQTKNSRNGRIQSSANLHAGFALPPSYMPINSAYEFKLRNKYYNKYGTFEDKLNIPAYLSDSTNNDYYGIANWGDLYYNRVPVFDANASVSGGTPQANFRFFLNGVKDANSADNTRLDRFNGSFYINVDPVKWLSVSSMVNYARMKRNRNRNITDRLSEVRYIPDLTNPLAPTSQKYSDYLEEYTKAIDRNINNAFQSSIGVLFRFGAFNAQTKLGIDYTEATRDVFWPGTLMEKVSFVSNYFGLSNRINLSNNASYLLKVADNQTLKLNANYTYNADVNRYNYAYAHNGPNDFVKLNSVSNDLKSKSFIPYFFIDKMRYVLNMFSGNVRWNLSDILEVHGTIRRDGSSAMQGDNRWITSYSGGVDYNLSKHLGMENRSVGLRFSYGKLPKLFTDDRFSAGPVYTSSAGWQNEPTLGTYLGCPVVTRPYTLGWIGYSYPWEYATKAMLGIDVGLLNNRINVSVNVFDKTDKNQPLLVPLAKEWGYQGIYKSGMEVNNKGLDIAIAVDVLKNKNGFGLRVAANGSTVKNKLMALPDGLKSIEMGESKLMVGKPVDGYWLYKNIGQYDPATSNAKTFSGIQLSPGDAQWQDVNNDGTINKDDKILTGNYMPRYFGGINTSLSYKKLAIDAQFTYTLKRMVLNQYASNRLNFINIDNAKDLYAVKDITFWQRKVDVSNYPMYNPWSNTVPYRLEQDLFLEDASYLKLRSITVSYGLENVIKKVKSLTVYLTGANLCTFTKFKGDDPELVDYNGIYTGRGLPIPKTIIAGVKIEF